jgi:hypothetical protein
LCLGLACECVLDPAALGEERGVNKRSDIAVVFIEGYVIFWVGRDLGVVVSRGKRGRSRELEVMMEY